MFLSTTLNAGRLCERQLGPSARSLIAYMSRASLKKGPAWGLSTTLDAGRLCERYGCGSSITLIIYAIGYMISISKDGRKVGAFWVGII